MIELIGTSLITISIALFITSIYLVLQEKHKQETCRKIWIRLNEQKYLRVINDEQ